MNTAASVSSTPLFTIIITLTRPLIKKLTTLTLLFSFLTGLMLSLSLTSSFKSNTALLTSRSVSLYPYFLATFIKLVLLLSFRLLKNILVSKPTLYTSHLYGKRYLTLTSVLNFNPFT